MCFIAGTLILTEEGYIPIEEITLADKVWAENPETGERELKQVVQTFENETSELIHVYVNGEEIVSTTEHPFYVINKGWVSANCLQEEDILVNNEGESVLIEKITYESLKTPIKVYNFEVEDFHTYYVGESSILVHNICDVARRRAVRQAWKNEQNNVLNGGDGISRIWTPLEKAELLARGKVTGYQGHHMKSVFGHPALAGDPTNVQFLPTKEHFKAHGFNWRNITYGKYIE